MSGNRFITEDIQQKCSITCFYFQYILTPEHRISNVLGSRAQGLQCSWLQSIGSPMFWAPEHRISNVLVSITHALWGIMLGQTQGLLRWIQLGSRFFLYLSKYLATPQYVCEKGGVGVIRVKFSTFISNMRTFCYFNFNVIIKHFF